MLAVEFWYGRLFILFPDGGSYFRIRESDTSLEKKSVSARLLDLTLAPRRVNTSRGIKPAFFSFSMALEQNGPSGDRHTDVQTVTTSTRYFANINTGFWLTPPSVRPVNVSRSVLVVLT